MLDFSELNVCDKIKNILLQHKVDYVFQPIIDRENNIVAHEALLRPEGCNVGDYIEQYKQLGRLHEIELLSFFGATLEYRKRNYDTFLSINSFPSECFSPQEAHCYAECFRHIHEKLLVEIVEFTEGNNFIWKTKKKHFEIYSGVQVVLDDFGDGQNDLAAVDYYLPSLVKLDRSLISGIHKNPGAQETVKYITDYLHQKNMKVLAEGVETEEEFLFLLDLAIDYFQGYYIARPA